jgi:hypothetical protein
MADKVLLVSPADAPAYAPGSVLFDAACGHRAWLSMAGMQMLLGGGFTTVCEDCADPAEAARNFAVSPLVCAELSALWGSGVAARQIAAVAADPAAAVRRAQESNRRRRGEAG